MLKILVSNYEFREVIYKSTFPIGGFDNNQWSLEKVLNLLKIYLYGIFKRKFKPGASLAEYTVITLPNEKNEQFQGLLMRLGLNIKECGDCFINGKLAYQDTIIPKDARIGLFPFGMHLLDGGQYIKGHGYITTNPYDKVLERNL